MNPKIYEGYRDLSSNILISENKDNAYERHFHRNIELIYVRSGMMEAIINGSEYQFHKDEIIFVPSYFTHEFSTPEHSDVLVLLIPYEILSDFNDFFKEKQLNPFLGDREYNCKIREVLELLLKMRAYNNQYVLKGFINIIFGLLINRYPLIYIRNNSNSNVIIQILTYIEENYHNPISLESIAARFNYNKYYISHLFRQYVGENFKNYINTIRIQHVISQYKQEPETNISAIAMRCGFNNMPTFYRTFKEICNMPPKDFFSSLSDNIEYNEWEPPLS